MRSILAIIFIFLTSYTAWAAYWLVTKSGPPPLGTESREWTKYFRATLAASDTIEYRTDGMWKKPEIIHVTEVNLRKVEDYICAFNPSAIEVARFEGDRSLTNLGGYYYYHSRPLTKQEQKATLDKVNALSNQIFTYVLYFMGVVVACPLIGISAIGISEAFKKRKRNSE